MDIMNIPGIRLTRTSTTQNHQNEDGTVGETTSCESGPKYDAFIARMKELEPWMFEHGPRIPANFLLDGISSDGTAGHMICDKVHRAYVQYYAGGLDEKGIESVLRDVVSDFRQSYVDQGFDPDEFMPQLLQDVYDAARFGVIHGVGAQNSAKARELAAYYNGDNRNSRDFFYYDADLYYQSEAMKDTTIEMMQKISKEYGVSGLEFPREYEDGDIRKRIYGSYNTTVNDSVRYNFLIGNIVDETMAPPKGFKFFYKGNDSGTNIYTGIPSSDGTPESAFDGILHVWYGDWSYVGRVPVRQDATRFPISVNMYEHISQSGSDIPQEIVSIMKNFDFFTVYLSGRYTDAHPRHF